MARFTFISFLYIFIVVYLINHVSMIPTEQIIGGDGANRHSLTYQVAILGKANLTDAKILRCSGAIIAADLVLSVARCLIDDRNNLQEYQYSIIADTINWTFEEGIEVLIDDIFLPNSDNYYIDNIAVLKLAEALNLANNPHLSELSVPLPNESFMEDEGIVSGYGHHWIIIRIPRGSLERIRVDAGSTHFLRYTTVQVTGNAQCSNDNESIDLEKQFCGLALVQSKWEHWGLCDNDEGSPLVINNKIVGLGSVIHEDCDDTQTGTVYTKVSRHSVFIKSIVQENPLPGTLIYKNRGHVRRIQLDDTITAHIAAPAA